MDKTFILPERAKTFWYFFNSPSLQGKVSVIKFFIKRTLRDMGFNIRADDELTVKIKQYDLVIHFVPSGGELRPYNDIFLNAGFNSFPDFAPERGKIVFDCGANIGLFSLRAALGRDNKVLAFEPNPSVFSRLLKNVKDNNLHNIKPIQTAIGSSCGTASFTWTETTPTGRIETGSSVDHKYKTVDVDIVTLDHVVEKHSIQFIDILKLDVEGHEYEALLGAENTLARTGRLVLEYHGEELRDKCGSFLIDKGFEMIHEIPGYQFYENRSSADRPAGVN